MTESGRDMLSLALDSVAFRPADRLRRMMMMVMKSSTISIMGIMTPKMIGVLSWSEMAMFCLNVNGIDCFYFGKKSIKQVK